MQNLWPEIERRAAHLPAAEAGGGIALVGAGAYGQAACDALLAQGIRVACFADNNPDKHGTLQKGVPVVPLKDLAQKKPMLTLITARHAVLPVAEQLEGMGIACLPFDAFFMQKHLGRFSKVRNTLADERSKQVYDHLLLTMLTGDLAYCASVAEGNHYFALPAFINHGGGHFVDAGAYVGDTVERFLWAQNGAFRKIYAFEPGTRQQAALKVRMRRLAAEWAFDESDCECVAAGLGDKEEEKTLVSVPGALIASAFSDSDTGGERLRITTLDRHLDGRPVSFLKADVEGMEMALLKGAADTIRRHKPKLTISVYHRPDDLFAIPEYIAGLVPEYKMAVRHHSPLMMDTVLYCWTEVA